MTVFQTALKGSGIQLSSQLLNALTKQQRERKIPLGLARPVPFQALCARREIPEMDTMVAAPKAPALRAKDHLLPVSHHALRLFMLSSFTVLCVAAAASNPGVQLLMNRHHVVMDNGLVQVTLSNPGGHVTGIRYNGIDNLLQVNNEEHDRGYWDIYWSEKGHVGLQHRVEATRFRVVLQNEKQVEISFSSTWNPSLTGSHVPLNIDRRFVLLQGSHGFYTYAIFEHLKGWPDFNLNLTRLVFKLRQDRFHYMAISESRQRFMPQENDRSQGRSQPLAYKEAVLLMNPLDQNFKGEVDDKYQYSCVNEENKVHGWISSNPLVGFWQISPSDEFRSGGPLKQELTSHVGPTTLSVFHSSHYMGQDLVPMFRNGEEWKKVFGPVFIYLNSGHSRSTLWKDANRQMISETQSWPYTFPVSDDFHKSNQRGSVRGTLMVRDRYNGKVNKPAIFAHVGLALPGELGSWQKESKGYQFWTKTGPDGSFLIKNIRVGDYDLYAWVNGFIGDYKHNTVITITPGGNIDLGNLVYEPPRDGPTLWEIGVPDRSAGEFFIPEPDPRYVNPLYLNQDRFRQYGLWDRYSSLYPNEDLSYTINVNDYRKDWFFAHVTRKKGRSYHPTTWKIKFKLDNVDPRGNYKLRVALASATGSELQVRFNDLNSRLPHFTTGLIGKDNAIARHGIHGQYWLFNIDVKGDLLVLGDNTIYLTQARHLGPFNGVMYDYIRMEGPQSTLASTKI